MRVRRLIPGTELALERDTTIRVTDVSSAGATVELNSTDMRTQVEELELQLAQAGDEAAALQAALDQAVTERGEVSERAGHLEDLLVVARHRRALEVLRGRDPGRAASVWMGLDPRVVRTLEHMELVVMVVPELGEPWRELTERGERMLEEVKG